MEIANVFPRLNSSTILNCQILSYRKMPKWALSNSPFISKLICFQKVFLYILATVKHLFEVAFTLLQEDCSGGARLYIHDGRMEQLVEPWFG